MARYSPVPPSATVCGVLLALSLTSSVAERSPLACGRKVTKIAHCACGLSRVPQVFVSAKSPKSAPAKVMLLMSRSVGRLLVSFTARGPLVVLTLCGPKVTLVGESCACATPVPVSGKVCGLPAALSAMLRAAVSLTPVSLGVKVTFKRADVFRREA